MKYRTILILRAMTKCNHMEGRKDGWYYKRNDQYEFGPISSAELTELKEEGLIHGISGVDRWLITERGWIELQKHNLVPDSVANSVDHNVHST